MLKSQSTKNKFIELAVAFGILVAVMLTVSRYLVFIESRQGVVINDPLLNLFSPVDLSWVCFSALYISIIIAIISLRKRPEIMTLALESYSIMVLLRMLTMYLLPLDPPLTTIPLDDPFVGAFTTGGPPPTRDLFFSGHTATMMILFLTAANKWLRGMFLVLGLGVVACVLAQHVHYTVDVVAAIPIAYFAYRIALLINVRLHGWDFIYKSKK
ncbi:MAG: phosphatase PAP2-related protein [Bacteroidota bacterium]